MTTEELQAQKLQLEIDKLNVDIEKSSSSFLKTSDFWKSIIPTIITTGGLLATLYFTVGRSFIDDEKRKLELQKEQLKLEVMKFENTRADIKKDIAASTIDKNALLSRIKVLQNQKGALGGNILFLKNNVKGLNEKISDLNFETYAIKLEYQDVKAAYSKDTAYYRTVINDRFLTDDSFRKQLADLKDKNEFLKKSKSDSLFDLRTENRYLRKKRKLSDLDILDMDEAVYKARTERRNKEIKKFDAEMDALKKSADRSYRNAEKSEIEAKRLDNQLSDFKNLPPLPSLLELSKQRRESRKQKQVNKK